MSEQNVELPASIQQAIATGANVVGIGAGGPVSASTRIEVERAIAEVKVMVLAAKQMPRDEDRALQQMLKACQRRSFAQVAVWRLPRGKGVSGPGIRFAEEFARCWGNIKYGYIEHSHSGADSNVETFAWDLESNLIVLERVIVKHEFAGGERPKDTDTQGIRMIIAAQAMRNVRNCILRCIPEDYVDIAYETCQLTNKESTAGLQKELADAIDIFGKRYAVTRKQIEAYIGRPVAQMTDDDLAELRGIGSAIKNGQARLDDYFPTHEEMREKLLSDPGGKAIAASAGKSGQVHAPQDEDPPAAADEIKALLEPFRKTGWTAKLLQQAIKDQFGDGPILRSHLYWFAQHAKANPITTEERA
jgi:hypothetical protein